jgi:hypothetical protein
MSEENSKVNQVNSWKKFALEAENHKLQMQKILSSYSKKRIVGFGSSARSQTFLNYCGFNENNILSIIDNNTMKQNLYSPGTNIEIVNFNKGISSKPDVIFILAWNFKTEIINQCKLAGYKGEFIVPFPNNPIII